MTIVAPDNVFATGSAKLLLFPDRIEQWRRGIPTIPVTLEIHLSERCNHRCPSCQSKYALGMQGARKRSRNGADLDLKLLDDVWRAPPEGIILSGHTGDPLLHPEIGDLLNHLEQLRITTALITNGEAMTPQVAIAAVKTCCGIRVSLDAAEPELFARTHGMRKDAWERVLAGVKMLVAARQTLPNPDAVLLGVGFLTSAATSGQMVAATQLAYELGVDYIQFRPFHFDRTDVSRELEACNSVAASASRAFRVLASTQKYDRLDAIDRPYKTCHGASFFSVLDSRGDLYLCCHHVGRPEAIVGSLTTESWLTFIEGSRRNIVSQQFPTVACIPNCRLHTQNIVLQSLQNGMQVEPVPLTPLTRRHAVFL